MGNEEADSFKKYLESSLMSEETIKKYMLYYNKFRYLIETVGEINQSIVYDFLSLYPHPTARATLRNYFEFMDLNYKLPKIKGRARKKVIKNISPNELEQIRENLYNIHFKYGLMFDLSLSCALRRQEVINIKMKDIKIDPETDIVRIKLVKAKGKKERTVIVGIEPAIKLVEWIYGENDFTMNDYIFPSPLKENKPMDKTSWNKAFRKATGKKYYPHLLRHCVCKDTEILTINGWKKYEELHGNEEILNYDINKKRIVKDRIKRVCTFNYNGRMVHLKNTYLDFLITPNHKIVVKEIDYNKKTDGWKLKPFNQIPKKIWNLNYLLNGKIENKKKVIGVERAGILGWILSDGYISHQKNSHVITISQSYSANKKKCDYIESLLINGNIPFTKSICKYKGGFDNKKGQMCYFLMKKGRNHHKNPEKKGDNHNWIYRFINKNRTPKIKEFFKLSLEELQWIYTCMMMGDGTSPKKYQRNREYCNQDKKRIEFFRILCFLIGHGTTQGWKTQNGKKYSRVYVRENKTYTQLSRLKNHIQYQDYKGVIWCPETTNGTFISKRKDKIAITGNTRSLDWFNKGLNIVRIQQRLGHSDISTTRRYINPDIEEELKQWSQETD
jgi:integrase